MKDGNDYENAWLDMELKGMLWMYQRCHLMHIGSGRENDSFETLLSWQNPTLPLACQRNTQAKLDVAIDNGLVSESQTRTIKKISKLKPHQIAILFKPNLVQRSSNITTRI